MTIKQSTGGYAPDGSIYITLTDGNGSLVTAGGSSAFTVGTTAITSGTSGRILYDNAGVVGEMTTSGSGTVVALTAGPTFTGTVTHPTPFTLGAVSVTTTGTQLNYLSAATGTTGTTSTNIVYSTSPTLVTPTLGVAAATSVAINGATIGTNALVVTGTAVFNNNTTLANTQILRDSNLAWTNSNSAGGSAVITLSRNADGVLQFGTSSANASGSVLAANFYVGATDTILTRDAANTLAQRNGTNANRSKVYNIFTDASNGEWFDIDWITNANVATIGTNNNGTGVARNLRVNIGGVNKLDYGVTNTGQWTLVGGLLINSTSSLTNSGDIFALVGRSLGWTGSNSRMKPQADGTITLFNSSENGFTSLQFGGTTSSFPALKRSTTILQARLADDSAYAPLQGKLRTDTNATTGLTAGVLSATTNATIVITDASGQDYRIPCII